MIETLLIAQSRSSLTFLPSNFSVLLSVILIAVTAWASFVSWRRSRFAIGVGVLETLRLLIMLLIAVLLNQPEWESQYQPETEPTIAVLWDNSPSMRTQDVDSASVDAQRQTRQRAIEGLKDETVWQSVGDDRKVVMAPIGQPDRGTNLNGPIQKAASEISELLGVVVISDGDWNEGASPADGALQLRMQNVPVYGVKVGSPQKLPDLELVNLDVPTFATLGKTVRIPFTIQSSLPRKVAATVSLKSSDGETMDRSVEIEPMSKTADAFLWKPDEVGDYEITVSLPDHPDDEIKSNNQRTSPIAIRRERLRVLVIESIPRWEYRYLRNALSRDPGIDVACLLFHPNLESTGGGSTDYIKSFPETIEELSPFDVVFLGDVGIGEDQLTREQTNLLKGLVQFQASGLVLMPGWQGNQFDLLDTDLNQLYPVDLDSLQPEGWGAADAGHFQLSEAGRRSLLTKLADTQEENAQVWEGLPGFQWFAPVVRSRPGTETLAVHGEVSNQYGRLPLLVTRTFGAGKVLFMGTDGAWRWRKGVEDKYHYRFWGQVVRWMAYQRNMARGDSMRFYYSPDQPSRRQTMSLTAHVISESGEPLENGNVVARIESPTGTVETVRLTAQGDQWGVYRGTFVPEDPGRHEVMVTSPESPSDLQTNFFVQGQVVETIGQPARPEVLDELATLTGGLSVRVDQVDQILDRLADLPLPPPEIRRVQLWCHPVTMAILLFALALFWVGRKIVGLI
ncbi:hypothetical protein [Crateriforma spongiae]|uniref:hypothetical protein n=1 Tax=Crateriforma spongiae TaxID=2724528 RepID=UPI001446A6AF|nr:hypothetical protein [Crateriforma spongiae]